MGGTYLKDGKAALDSKEQVAALDMYTKLLRQYGAARRGQLQLVRVLRLVHAGPGRHLHGRRELREPVRGRRQVQGGRQGRLRGAALRPRRTFLADLHHGHGRVLAEQQQGSRLPLRPVGDEQDEHGARADGRRGRGPDLDLGQPGGEGQAEDARRLVLRPIRPRSRSAGKGCRRSSASPSTATSSASPSRRGSRGRRRRRCSRRRRKTSRTCSTGPRARWWPSPTRSAWRDEGGVRTGWGLGTTRLEAASDPPWLGSIGLGGVRF